MTKSILYSIGKTSLGELVKASDAQKEISYACPICSQPLVLRKGSQKRPHFAHKVLSPNCKPETALHYSFKTLLFQKIREHLEKKLALPILWHCCKCSSTHTGNLLKKATSASLEHNLGVCQPDIALMDSSGNVVVVIEVIVTHKPEESALSYYSRKNIAVVSYQLKSDEDLNFLEESPLKPSSVSVCTHPKCKKCKNHMPKKRLLIIEGKCWKCHKPIKVAALDGDMGYEGEFSSGDVQLAAQHGVLIKSRYSHTMKTQYRANTCQQCGTLIGRHYLFTDYIAMPEYPRQAIEAGYYCPHCS